MSNINGLLAAAAAKKAETTKTSAPADDGVAAFLAGIEKSAPPRANPLASFQPKPEIEIVASSANVISSRPVLRDAHKPAAFEEFYDWLPVYEFTSSIANSIVIDGKRKMLPYKCQDPQLAASLSTYYRVNAANSIVRMRKIEALRAV